jgi:hypothetical protein
MEMDDPTIIIVIAVIVVLIAIVVGFSVVAYYRPNMSTLNTSCTVNAHCETSQICTKVTNVSGFVCKSRKDSPCLITSDCASPLKCENAVCIIGT